MVKRRKANEISASNKPANSGRSVAIEFPSLCTKELTWEIILNDQILIIPGFFSPSECQQYVKLIDGLPLEMTPPKRRGEADRFSVSSPTLASSLFALLSPNIPSFKSETGKVEVTPTSCNSNIRLYKYETGHYFGPHYDDSVRDALSGERSQWTVLVYLTGAEDGVDGGETVFYKNHQPRSGDAIVPSLRRGTALLHRHGNDCLLHEGSLVKKGIKYVLRSDLMFG